MSHLSLSLFGGFEVTLDGERISEFGSDKTRALLAYLAIESARPHRRAELAAMLWPDLAEKKAAHNLSQTVLRLRRALREETSATRPPFLLLTNQDIQINACSDYQLDVAQFQELIVSRSQHYHPDGEICNTCIQWLHQAVNLYRGDLLAGFFVRDSVAFDEWRLSQQEKLHIQALEALSDLATFHEQHNDYEQAQVFARRQVTMEPWREEAHAQLMRALALGGQFAAALEQFESYRHSLAEELGIEPSARIISLYKQIRSGQFGEERERAPSGSSEHETIWLPGHGERRQITALICGRRNTAGRGDPEELHEQLTHCAPYCEKILNRFGGYRIQQHGDQCLVYFGYPRNYEDAARRAVHSGLAIVDALKSSDATDSGGNRIGIHTGDMLIGERRGPGWRDRDLVSDVPALARACQSLAGSGQVVMSGETERLVRGWFSYHAVAMPPLPESDHPLEVYEVRGESHVRSHLDWLAQSERLTLFVGREPEIGQLIAQRDQACAGHGQTVLVTGEPGIGKSRLVWELKRSAPATSPLLWLESRCSPYFQNTSLYPVTDLLTQLLGFEADDSPEVKRHKLSVMLARLDLTHPSAVWSLSLLLGLPTEASVPETITAAQRERMREIFVALLQKHALEQPLVLVIEDLHWSDPSTIEWLGSSLNALATVPCLILLTARPTFHPSWVSCSSLFPLTLEPLNPAQAKEMVELVAGGTPIDETLCQRIVTQTDGIPLFVEELTKALLDEPIENGKPYLPATLRELLLTRLDHLGTAKEIAQWAAAIGREFTYPVLREATRFDEQRLQDDLAKLIAVGLLYGQGQAPHTHYVFNHALVQEAAYSSLPKPVRQTYHRKIAEALLTRFPHIADSQPEVLARHLSQARQNSQAADYWLLAGERATTQGATQEARTFFDEALAHIEPTDDARRWRAYCGREAVLHLQGDRVAQKADLVTLKELAEGSNNDTRRAEAFLRQAQLASWQDDYPAMLQAAEIAITAANRVGNLALELRARTGKIVALTTLGEYAAAQQAVEETIEKAQGNHVDEVLRAYTLSDVAFYYVESGDLSRAIQLMCQGVEGARKAGDRQKESVFDTNLGYTYAQLGLYAQARAALEAGLSLAEVVGDRRLQARQLTNLGFVHWRTGDLDTAHQMAERVRQEFLATDDLYGKAVHLTYLGYILEECGHAVTAVESLTQACAIFAQIEMVANRYEVQTALSRCMLSTGQRDEALRLALEAWNYLLEHGTTGMGSPSWAYVCLADFFDRLNEPEQHILASAVIETGYRELMRNADKISDAAWRSSFLMNVAENRAIAERWRETQFPNHSL